MKEKILNQFFELSKSISKFFYDLNSDFSPEDLNFMVKIFNEFYYLFKEFRSKMFETFKKKGIKSDKTFEKIYDKTNSYYPLSIEKKGEIIKIEIPLLTPKKVFQKDKKEEKYIEYYYSSYLIDSVLFDKLKEFKKVNHIKKFNEKYMLYFVNEEKLNQKKATISDTDNHEYQVVVNTISSVFFNDDGPSFLSHYHNSIAGKEDKTVIYLIPSKNFDEVLNNAILQF